MKNSHEIQRGFALVVGLIFLLVLTVLAIVVMRGTQLELAMSTAVTRQEQALEAADTMRAVTREFMYANGEKLNLDVKEGAVPEFVYTDNCSVAFNSNFGTDLQPVDNSTSQATQMLDGLSCFGFGSGCFEDRLQDINRSPTVLLDQASLKYCTTGTNNSTEYKMSVNAIQLSVLRQPGIDISSPGEEQRQIYALVTRGRTDAALSETVLYGSVQTKRN
jgi:hypothetical protein